MRRCSASALQRTQPSLASTSRPSLLLPHQFRRGARPSVKLPCRRPAALFDDEDSEGELFAPYWGQQEVDWEDTPKDDNSLGDVWYEGDATPEDLAQNALAVALSVLLVWGVGSILWKLLVVSYALFAAAFRYSFVALVLLIVVIFLAS